MSGRDWHRVRVAQMRQRIENAKPLVAPLLRRTGPEHRLPPYVFQYRDSKGQPISLPKVSLVDRYNEDGTPKKMETV